MRADHCPNLSISPSQMDRPPSTKTRSRQSTRMNPYLFIPPRHSRTLDVISSESTQTMAGIWETYLAVACQDPTRVDMAGVNHPPAVVSHDLDEGGLFVETTFRTEPTRGDQDGNSYICSPSASEGNRVGEDRRGLVLVEPPWRHFSPLAGYRPPMEMGPWSSMSEGGIKMDVPWSDASQPTNHSQGSQRAPVSGSGRMKRRPWGQGRAGRWLAFLLEGPWRGCRRASHPASVETRIPSVAADHGLASAPSCRRSASAHDPSRSNRSPRPTESPPEIEVRCDCIAWHCIRPSLMTC